MEEKPEHQSVPPLTGTTIDAANRLFTWFDLVGSNVHDMNVDVRAITKAFRPFMLEKIDLSRTAGCSSEPSILISGYRASVTIADPFILTVMAALRVFLKDGEWVMPMEEAWSKYGERVIRDLWKA